MIVIIGAGESGIGAALLAKKLDQPVYVTDVGVIKEKYKEELISNNVRIDRYLKEAMPNLNATDEIYLYNNGIEHEFIDFEHPIYKQQGKIFSPNLSVIDCIFNIGFQGLKDILKKKVN